MHAEKTRENDIGEREMDALYGNALRRRRLRRCDQRSITQTEREEREEREIDSEDTNAVDIQVANQQDHCLIKIPIIITKIIGCLKMHCRANKHEQYQIRAPLPHLRSCFLR